jgi:hypothetical protein
MSVSDGEEGEATAGERRLDLVLKNVRSLRPAPLSGSGGGGGGGE